MLTRRSLWLFALALGVFSADGARAFDLPPYDAVYDMRLTKASASGGPRAVAGTYDYRVDETCSGWETKSHILLDLTFSDDQIFTNERFFTSWEAKNSATYRFAVQTVKNGITVEAFKGTANIGAKGGEALYEPLDGSGKKVTLLLPAGTLLPIAHERALLEHAEQGDALFRSVVMNGSSSTGPRIMSIAIGPRMREDQNGSQDPGIDPKLLETPSWRLSSALFNLREQRETPNTEMSVQLYESGIVQSFEQTFSDFAVSGTLARLKRLVHPACG